MRDFFHQLCRLYSLSCLFYLISCACDLFDQLCLIFDQLCVSFSLTCTIQSNLYMSNVNFCKDHRDKTEVPDPLAVENLISYKLNNTRE